MLSKFVIGITAAVGSFVIIAPVLKADDNLIVKKGEDSQVTKKKSNIKKKKKQSSGKIDEVTSDQPTNLSGGLGLTGGDEDMVPPNEDDTTNVSGNIKQFGLGINAGFAYLGFGGGLDVWHSPNRKLDLSFRLLGGSTKLAASGNDILYLETAQIKLMQLAFNARYFIGKSFFLLGGIGLNSYSGAYGVTVNPSKKEFLLPMKASALSLNLALGNMWKWDTGFTLGFDWLGYSLLGAMNLSLEDPDNAEEIQVFEAFRTIPGGGDPKDKAKSLVAKNNIYLLMMTLGYAF